MQHTDSEQQNEAAALCSGPQRELFALTSYISLEGKTKKKPLATRLFNTTSSHYALLNREQLFLIYYKNDLSADRKRHLDSSLGKCLPLVGTASLSHVSTAICSTGPESQTRSDSRSPGRAGPTRPDVESWAAGSGRTRALSPLFTTRSAAASKRSLSFRNEGYTLRGSHRRGWGREMTGSGPPTEGASARMGLSAHGSPAGQPVSPPWCFPLRLPAARVAGAPSVLRSVWVSGPREKVGGETTR